MTRPPRPRTILFDWDNTLVDTWGVIHGALNATFEAMGEPTWTLAETRARVRQSAREAFPAWFGERADEASRIFYETFEARHLDGLAARPGAAPLLSALSAAGYDLGVVSNKQGRLLRREVSHLGWDVYFRRLVGATDAPRDKPDPTAVELALRGGPTESRANSVEVWLVGDTDIDLTCARNAACYGVLMRETPPADGEFAGAPPELHVASCYDLSQILTSNC